MLLQEAVVIGYYTISMGSVDFSSLPQEYSLRLPKYPIPIARIARLAVNSKKQGQGWGEFLLVDAIHRIRDAASVIAAFAVIVDAKDEQAKAFYVHYGFTAFTDNDLCLFLPIASLSG